MVELVRLGQLTAADAIAVANAIHRVNPFHITEAIVARFLAKLRGIKEG